MIRRILGALCCVAVLGVLVWNGVWGQCGLDTEMGSQSHREYFTFYRSDSAGTIIDTTDDLKIVFYPDAEDTAGNGTWLTYTFADSEGTWYADNIESGLYDPYIYHGAAAAGTLMTEYDNILVIGRNAGHSFVACSSAVDTNVIKRYHLDDDVVGADELDGADEFTVDALTATEFVTADTITCDTLDVTYLTVDTLVIDDSLHTVKIVTDTLIVDDSLLVSVNTVTIGDGASGDVTITLDGDGGTDGQLTWDPTGDEMLIPHWDLTLGDGGSETDVYIDFNVSGTDGYIYLDASEDEMTIGPDVNLPDNCVDDADGNWGIASGQISAIDLPDFANIELSANTGQILVGTGTTYDSSVDWNAALMNSIDSNDSTNIDLVVPWQHDVTGSAYVYHGDILTDGLIADQEAWKSGATVGCLVDFYWKSRTPMLETGVADRGMSQPAVVCVLAGRLDILPSTGEVGSAMWDANQDSSFVVVIREAAPWE